MAERSRRSKAGARKARSATTTKRKAGAPRPSGLTEAAQRADVGALKVLLGRGGDLNASYRNYRPLHALIQERPHDSPAGKAETKRLACLEWLLENGADPDALGA